MSKVQKSVEMNVEKNIIINKDWLIKHNIGSIGGFPDQKEIISFFEMNFPDGLNENNYYYSGNVEGCDLWYEYFASIDIIFKAIKENRCEYNSKNQLTKLHVNEYATTTYEYDDGDRLITVSDNFKWREKYKYDDEGRCIEYHFNIGNDITKFEYDDEGRLVQLIDQNNIDTIKYKYNDEGQLIERKRSDGETEKIKYDSHGNVTEIKDSSGSILKGEYEYDDEGRLTRFDCYSFIYED